MKKCIRLLFISTLVGLFFALTSIRASERIVRKNIIVDGKSEDWVGITPLKNLNWKTTLFPRPVRKEERRIKSVRISHNAKNFFLLLEIDPGIKEFFEQKRRTGHIGYIFVDSDDNESTGTRRESDDKYSGWDYRIYIPTGFAGSMGRRKVRPIVEYKVERMKKFIMKKTKHGYTYHCEYEKVAGGSKCSEKDPTYISFKGKFLEMRFPFNLLDITLPTNMRLVIQDLTAFPVVETETMHIFLNK